MAVTRTAALAEPVVPVRRAWIGLLFAANLGLWMALYTPLQVLLPEQIEDLGVGHKEIWLGIVTGLGAIIAVVVNPLAGALSDRTRPRLFGREYGALAALLRAGQRLPEVRLALTFNLLSVAFGCAMSALLCPDDPIFAGLSRPARGALNLAVVALWAGAERFASAPFFWTEQYGVPLRYVGRGSGWDSVTVEGAFEDRSLVARYFVEGTHCATATIGRDRANLEDELRLEARVEG